MSGRSRWLGWAERQALRRATGGRVEERPRSLEDAARTGLALVVQRPLTIGRLAGGTLALIGAITFWAGLDVPVRDVLEALTPGWIEDADGAGGNPVAVALALIALTVLVAAPLLRLGRAACVAWDEARIDRRTLAMRLMAAPAAIVFGAGLTVLGTLIATGAGRGGDGLFSVGPVLAVIALAWALWLLWLDAWVRTLLLVRLGGRARRAAAARGRPDT